MFGIARRPGHIFFDPARDVLYFGPCDGFMAAEAQLRTILALADPDELAQVRRVALSATVLSDGFVSPPSYAQPSPPASTSLAVDVLHLLRAKLPHLRELFIVPHEENLSHSDSAALLIPPPLPPMLTQPGPLPVSSDPGLPVGGAAVSAADGSVSQPLGLDSDGLSMLFADASFATEATVRLAQQVHAAMRRVCMAAPDWKLPQWRILFVSSGSAKQLRQVEAEVRVKPTMDARVQTMAMEMTVKRKTSMRTNMRTQMNSRAGT